MSNANRANFVKYLGLGYKPGDVAKIFGVTPAVISQFLDEEGVIDEVRTERAKNNLKAAKIDDNYLLIEEHATSTILDRVKQGFYKPTELLAVATMANKATKKIGGVSEAEGGGETVSVRISLPTNLVGIEIIKTAKNQVLRVGDVSLQPLSKDAIHEMASVRQLPPPVEKHFEV
jgi:predicted transcriptional regulator